LPPQSIEAESSVLGSLLLDNGAWDRCGDLLTDKDFYRVEHQLIFAAIGVMVNSNKPADVITVYQHLLGTGKAEAVGGLEYLNSLAQYVASASNIRRYSELVRESALRRRLVSVGDEITASAFATDGTAIKDLLDSAEKKVLAIGETHGRGQDGFDSLDDIVVKVLDRIQTLADNPDAHAGLHTGFVDLDRMTSGLQGGDLVILAARPSMGKTALAINIAEHVAIKECLPVAIFSMEMGSEQLGIRLVGSIGRVDQTHLRTGQLTDDEWPRLSEAIETLRNVPLHVQETPGLTINELRASARRLARQCGGQLGLIVVDYLQLMTVSATAAKENRATAVGELSVGLKALAKELKCPVICLSQLNRAVEQRPDKRPMMSDLRESGNIEQDADIIMFIYRDEYYTKDQCKEPGIAEIIIAKQRNGPTGVVKLAWLPALTKFESLARGY
jgi:replicative DNA helicase